MGILQIGDDGWILNEEDYNREDLLHIPHVVDGGIYEPQVNVQTASGTSGFDQKYRKVIREVYADKNSYGKAGRVLLGDLNTAFGKHGLPHIASQKRKELEEPIQDELAEITVMAFRVITETDPDAEDLIEGTVPESPPEDDIETPEFVYESEDYTSPNELASREVAETYESPTGDKLSGDVLLSSDE